MTHREDVVFSVEVVSLDLVGQQLTNAVQDKGANPK